MTTLDRAYQVIQKPVITEKTTNDGFGRNAVTFRVPRDANKIEIRNAVERLFDVKVKSVNTLHIQPKWRRRGRSFGQTQVWKKAMVVLHEGHSIDFL